MVKSASSKTKSKTASEARPRKRRRVFQAEVSKLLHLMVHSVYSEREVFLRELISNAADACDKLRYEALTQPKLLRDDTEFKITVALDRSARTLTVTDNGIGMSDDEMAENLGTIARSGTRAFLDGLTDEKDGSALIGQFGVGFYSAFMVADEVRVLSRRADQGQTNHWISNGEDGFSIGPAPKGQELDRGTQVTLVLKDDADVFLDSFEIERVIKAYSDHITFPIELAEAGSDVEPKQINSASALWTRPKSDITEEQYTEFYRHVGTQFDSPALTIHYRAEGRHEYVVLLFIPGARPLDLFDPDRKGRVRLYVRKVFITDDAEILPAYLRFMRGIIDSEDMPLNVSREMLQNNPIVESIRRAVTNRALSELKKTADKDAETFQTIWEAFGPVIKEGLYEDLERRDDLLALARFRTTKSGDGWRNLKDYVADLKDNQTAIYYAIGESLDQVKASPQLEGFAARDVEVLLLSDPVDNFWTTSVIGFDGKPFRSVTQGDADLSEIARTDEGADTDPGELAGFVTKLKDALGDAVCDVRVSKRLTSSPCCLVAPEGGPDRGLDKILSRQRDSTAGVGNPILEINATHELVREIAEKTAKGGVDASADAAWLLFDQACILDGDTPKDPAAHVERLTRILTKGF